MMEVDAVVLAGGGASRMGGANKPALLVGEQSLLDRVLGALRGAVSGRLIVVGAIPPMRRDQAVQWVQEAPPGGGPLPALAAGLTRVRSALTVAMAADLPFVTPPDVSAVVHGLAASGTGVAGAVVVDPAGRHQWLFSAWRTDALRQALQPLDRLANRPLSEVLGRVPTVAVTLAVDVTRPPPWLDCDTPSDLARARQAVNEALGPL